MVVHIHQPNGVDDMYYNEIDERVCDIAEYVAATGATVRETAKLFGVSKSTVHKDLTERLKTLAPQLYEVVKNVLSKNRAERHIRGGRATKLKYETEKQKTS